MNDTRKKILEEKYAQWDEREYKLAKAINLAKNNPIYDGLVKSCTENVARIEKIITLLEKNS